MIFGKRSEDLQVSFHPILLALAIRRVGGILLMVIALSLEVLTEKMDNAVSVSRQQLAVVVPGPSFIVGNGKEHAEG